MRTPLLMLVATLNLTSCAGTGPNVFRRPAPLPVEVPCLPALDAPAGLPAYLVPAPAGSTPRQRRQWQKAQAANLARAGVLPTILKNSSLAQGPGAVATTVTKPRGPVAAGPGAVATDARKAGQHGGGGVATAPAAVAAGAAVIKRNLPWWLWVLAGTVALAGGWKLRGKLGR